MALLASFILARCGQVLAVFIGKPAGRPGISWGTGLLAGILVQGLALLSLALTGLFYPPLIIILCAVLALPSPLPMPAWSTIPARFTFNGILLGATLFLLAIPIILSPVTQIDAFLYHLASGWQFLQAHRVLLSDVPFEFHYPLPVEMVFVPAIILGDDRLTTCISLSAVAAVFLVFMPKRRPAAGILGLLVFASSGPFLTFINGKNDVIAAAFFVAGALLAGGNNRRAGALLLGACVSAKPILAPLAFIWWLFMRQKGTSLLGVESLLLAIPSLPWLVKSFLATGNPLFPVGSGLVNTSGWGPPNIGRMMDYWTPLWMAGTGNWRTFPSSFLECLPKAGIITSIAMAGMLALVPRRRTQVIVLLASEALLLGLGHTTRYWMPAIWLVSLYSAEALVDAGSRYSRFLVPLAGAWSVCAILLNPAIRGFTIQNLYRTAITGTFGEACRQVAAANPHRILVIGELRTYLVPGRAVYDGLSGETPVAWKIASESWTAEDAARKLRQTGASHVLYNYISPQYSAGSMGKWFPWTRRMGRLWEELCRSHLETVSTTRSCDYTWGGYYLYRIRQWNKGMASRELSYLPGADALISRAAEMRTAGDIRATLGELRRLSGDYPLVLSFRCELGGQLAKMLRWNEALECLRPAVVSGMMHPSIPLYGLCLYGIREFSAARLQLQACLPRYPADEAMIRLGLASSCIEIARISSKQRQYSRAESLLAEAEGVLIFTPMVRVREVEGTILEYQAWISAVRAGIRASLGDCPGASALYRKAAGLIPGYSESENWGELALNPCK